MDEGLLLEMYPAVGTSSRLSTTISSHAMKEKLPTVLSQAMEEGLSVIFEVHFSENENVGI